MILGLKLLTEDGESLNSSYGRVKYPADGSWVDVPGNGTYIARTGGLTSGGHGPVLAVLECDINTRRATSVPDGVECFGRVRRVPELEAKFRADAVRGKAYAVRVKADAVRAIIGVGGRSFACSHARIVRVAVKPSMIGICRSIRTRS